MLNDRAASNSYQGKQFRTRIEWLDRRAVWLLPLYLSIYIGTIAPGMSRQLWYDELFTYYISTSGSVDKFVDGILNIDANPPLSYPIFVVSLWVFGDTPIAIRIPSAVAFFLASLIVFFIVRRRLGGFWALTAMVLLWSWGHIRYATEARPYALFLLLISLALYFWIKIKPGERTTSDHWGFGLSLTGMLLTHCIGLFFAVPFIISEIVRTITTKKFNKSIWVVLLTPLLAVITYVPLMTDVQSYLYPANLVPSLKRAAVCYFGPLVEMGPTIVVPLLIVIMASTPTDSRSRLRLHELVCLVCMMLTPVTIMLYFKWSEMAYWPRYGIGAIVAFSLGTTFHVARKVSGHATYGAVSAAIVLIAFCFNHESALKSNWQPSSTPSTEYRQIHSDLPFVSASGLVFLEMDHAEPPDFQRRLYYLTDKDSAIQYSNETIFEDLPRFARYFPVRATVMPYRVFVTFHRRFVVSSRPEYTTEWLLKKLRDDGATIQPIESIQVPYHEHKLYSVALDGVL